MKARIIILVLALASFMVLLGQRGGTQVGQTALAGVAPSEFGADMPVGSIIAYAGSTAPDGWLMCDGALYDTSALPELFDVIEFTYGSNAKKDAFRVPDLAGKVPVGQKPFTYYCDTLGKTGGQAEVSLSESEMPSHKHDVSASSHSHGINVSPHNHNVTVSPHNHSITDTGHDHSINDPGHSHSINDPGHAHSIRLDEHTGQGRVDDSGSGERGSTWTGSNTTGITVRSAATHIGINSRRTGITVQGDALSVSLGSTTAGASVQDTNISISEDSKGSDSAHENMQPYIVLNYIIKY